MSSQILFAISVFFGMMFLACGLPVPTALNCTIPPDLNVRYEKLTSATIGNKFLLPAQFLLPPTNSVSHRGDTTCPKTSPSKGGTQDRSTCPWYTKITVDSTLFPPFRSEAVCRCRDCIGSDGLHSCERVYSNRLFLKRTTVCVDGLFVFEPITLNVVTGCVCAHKKIASNDDGGRPYDI